MLKELFPSLLRGINKLKKVPQLWYTIFVAIVIGLAFSIVVINFVNIAKDAQDRLVRNRIGQLQDSFVQFASDYLETEIGKKELQDKIQKIVVNNRTITDFKVVEFINDSPIIASSINRNEIGKPDSTNYFLYNNSKIDPDSSHHIEQISDVGRYFITVRMIKDDYGKVVGAVLIKSYLSEADAIIDQNIKNGLLFFIIISVLIMFLFFRHARIIDYSVLYRKVKEVDQLKDDFISMASHELRTPLTVIRGYVENLLESNLNDEQKLSAQRIDISAKQLDDLVNDMLDVSRIEQGRIDIKPEILNPNTLIADVVSGFVKITEDKGLKIFFKHSIQENIKLQLDPNRFRQVMTNLIGNAIKYTNNGEVKITAEIEANNFVIRVSDTGIGMTADEQKNLFQKFYRVKNTETKEIRGTGLGLWITKQIIELMGGKISVESIKGVGTHFVISFNLSK